MGLNIHRCFTRNLNFQLVSGQVHLLWFNYLSAILDSLAMDEAMEKAILNCYLNICDNDSMSMFEDCQGTPRVILKYMWMT